MLKGSTPGIVQRYNECCFFLGVPSPAWRKGEGGTKANTFNLTGAPKRVFVGSLHVERTQPSGGERGLQLSTVSPGRL
jgi:hypothetical protein